MKRILSVLLVVVLVCASMCVVASAAETDPVVSPRWTNTATADPVMSIVDGVGYAELLVVAKHSPKTFTVDTYVYVQSGSDWVYVTEQHDTTTGMMIGTSCQFNAVSGKNYKAEYTVTVTGGGVTETLYFTSHSP